MAKTEGLSGKVGLNTTDFKTNITAMNRDLRVLESSFRAGAAALTNWSGTATGLESRIKSLTDQIDIQKDKVAALTAEHDRLVQAEGANSAGAEGMQIRVNSATQTLNKMQTELGQDQAALEQMKNGSNQSGTALALLGLAADGATIGLAALKDVAQALVLVFQALVVVVQTELAVAFGVLEVGVGAVLGLGAAAVIAGVAIAGLTFKAADTSKQLEDLSVQTGISTQRLQEMGYIGKQVGTDLNTMTTDIAHMIRSMEAAKTGTNAQAKAFKELGITVKDSSGQLRDSNVVFGEVLDALGKIKDPTERDALAMQIFGKSAQDLNPLIKLGSKGMEEMADKAKRLGAVLSDDTIKKLGDLQTKLNDLVMGLKGVGTQILAAFAPFFGGMLDKAIGYLERLISIVQYSCGDLNKMAMGISGLFTTIVQDIAKALPEFLKNAQTIIQSLVDALDKNLPALTKAGVSIVKMLADFIIQNLPLLGATAATILTTLVNAILPLLPTLMSVGLGIILTLVEALVGALPALLPKLADTGMKIIKLLLGGIAAALPLLIQIAPQILQTLIQFLKENLTDLIAIGIPLITQLIQAILPFLPMLVEAAIQILVALANAITQQLPTLVPVIVQVVMEIVQILIQNAPLLINAAGFLIIALIQGFANAAPQFYAMAPVILNTMAQAILILLPVLVNLGMVLLQTLVDGWTASLHLITEAGLTLMARLINAISGALGQAIAIGAKIVQSIWQGIQGLYSWLYGLIYNFISSILSSVLSSLGLGGLFGASFSSLGDLSAQAFSKAFFNGLADLQRQANYAMQGLSMGALAGSAAGAGGNSSVQTDSFAFYAPVYVGATTPGSLGASLKGRRY